MIQYRSAILKVEKKNMFSVHQPFIRHYHKKGIHDLNSTSLLQVVP